MRGERVPERMQRDAPPSLVDVGGVDRMHELTRELARADRIENAAAAREEPNLGSRRQPPGAQRRQKLRRQLGFAILASLALLDAERHGAAVDIGDFERSGLASAQARAVGHADGCTIFKSGRCGDDARHLLGREDGGKRAALLEDRHTINVGAGAERDAQEEAQSGRVAIDRANAEALPLQMQQEGACVFCRQLGGSAPQMGAARANRAQVGLLRRRC